LTETIDDLAFDETSLPGPLRPLVPFYRRFAVADDGERERLIEAAAPADLEQLVQAVNPLWRDINAFLDIDSGSNEEGLTDSLAQAAMQAQIELRNRSL
jgi:hypothetical protein